MKSVVSLLTLPNACGIVWNRFALICFYDLFLLLCGDEVKPFTASAACIYLALATWLSTDQTFSSRELQNIVSRGRRLQRLLDSFDNAWLFELAVNTPPHM